MNLPTVSFWEEGHGNKKRWVYQVRLRRYGQKPLSVQRRHKVKSIAYERAVAGFQALTKSAERGRQLKVVDALRRYLEALEGTVKDTTIGEYAYQLDRYFCAEFGQRELASIAPDDLRGHLKKLLASGLSVATVNTIRTRVSSLYNFMIREQLTDKNPAALVSPLRKSAGKPSKVQPPWNLAETRSALALAEHDPLHLFLMISLLTGLRRGEAVGLTWGDFDDKKSLLMVTKSVVSARSWQSGRLDSGTFVQEPKTTSSHRNVYCSQELLKAIYKARRRFTEQCGRLPTSSDPMIFHSAGNAYAPSSIGHRFAKFCAKNQLRKIRVHDLRHTSAVLALEAGIPLEAVSEGLGHSGVDITKRIYAPKVPGLGIRYATELDGYLMGDHGPLGMSSELGVKHA